MPTSYIIPPFSTACLNAGSIYPNYYVGVGGGVQRLKGIGILGTGTINATGELAFQIPKGLPSGTPKLNGYAISPISGVATYEVMWTSVSSGLNPALRTPVSEGSNTITWVAGQSGVLKPISITLDAYTSGIAPGDVLLMDVRFISSWTLTQPSFWRFWVEYE